MKKFLFYFLSLFIFISLTSCGSNEIRFETKSHIRENGDIIIEYPTIKNGSGKEFNEYISGYVSEMCADIVGDEGESFDIDIKYSVYVADDTVSVLFEGEVNYCFSAHPVNVVYSVNYSIGDDLPLDDILGGKTKDDIVKCALNNEILSELYSETDILEYIGKASVFGSQVCYYRTPDGVYITLPVPHAVGDYVKVKI